MKRTIVLSLLVLLVAAPQLFSRIEIQTGHAGPVNDVAVSPDRMAVYSAGEDGKLKYWDLEENAIERTIQVSQDPLVDMSLHPDGTAVAVVASGGGAGATLSVWDTQDGGVRFRVALPEKPLYLSYSPGGSYIVYSLPDFQSLSLIDSSSGRALPYLQRGTGIASYFAVSSSEETIMTYVPSAGRIDYYRISSGERIESLQTRQQLRGMQLLPGKRHAVAHEGSSLVIVDVLNGKVLDTYPLGAVIRAVAVDQSSGTIGVWTERLDSASSRSNADSSSAQSSSGFGSGLAPVAGGFRTFNFSGSFLFPAPGADPQFHFDGTALAMGGGFSVTGSSDGAVAVTKPRGNAVYSLASISVEEVTGVAVSHGSLHLTLGNRLLSLRTELFEQTTSEEIEIDSFSSSMRTLAYERITGIINTPTRYLYLWGPRRQQYVGQDRGALLTEFDPVTGSTREISRPDWSRILDVTWFDNTLLLFHEDGVIRQIDPFSGETRYRYSALGIQKVLGTERYGIVVARNRTNPFESSLLQIDATTGETVLLEHESFMVFDLAYDRQRRRLYTLGLHRSADGTETVVQRLSGSSLSIKRTIQRVPGEILDANIALSPDSRNLYSSLGDGAIIGFGRSGVRSEYRQEGHNVKSIVADGNLLFALNDDGSLTIFSPEREQPLLQLTAFADGTWVALTRDGAFFTPDDRAVRHLRYISERSIFPRDLDDFRVELPLRLDLR